MKWIGQHIYDLVSRFRDDVYLEDLSTTTETNVLVVDSDGKVSKTTSITGDITGIDLIAGTAIDLTSISGSTGGTYAATIGVDVSDFMDNGTDNYVLTATGADAINAEANLQFDGSTLSIEADANTTANALFVDANALTTGSAIYLDIDDVLTATATKSLVNVDYDKTGVTEDGQTSTTVGLDINMADAATNHVNGRVLMIGAQIDVDSANAQGAITQKGLILNVAADGVGDAANTFGIQMEVMDGGEDIRMSSSADVTDYCTIATGAAGATTITTVDTSVGNTADFTISADGKIDLRPAEGRAANVTSTAASAAGTGGSLNLVSNDGAALGDDHRLGKLGFQAAEDASGTLKQGAYIAAFADAAWSVSENGTRLEFYTMDGNASSELSLTLDSDRLATFTGQIMSKDTTTSSNSTGGTLRLVSDDGAAVGYDHRLGVINFQAAEDGSGTLRTGAKIQAFADAAWSESEKGTRLEL